MPLLASTVFIILGLTSCGNKYYTPPLPLPNDMRHVPVKPKVRDYNITADLIDKQITLQIEQSLDLSRQFRNLFHKKKQAYNVDPFDEVSNSSWFTNRNAKERLTLEEISRGPDNGSGPDTTWKWIVTRAKGEGVTPGFSIMDKNGDNYLIKFDPIGFSELVTGAEVVSTKLLYAAGYNVPENYITYFHPRILELGEGVKFTDSKGRKRSMTWADLEDLIGRVHTLPGDRIRALASKYIPGEPVGPFSYRSIRKDDPNDIIPHHHRRELRGLKVVAAWLNHVDTKSGNSLDTYVTDGNKSYVKHYLIDFGSTLGSAAHGPMVPRTGHENQIDPNEIFINMMTLGFYIRPYEKLKSFEHPSIGLYEADLFDPGGFKFSVPNPAFDNCTNRDGFWGAKLVMSFTDEQLAAAVHQGCYTDPEAEAYLLQVLKERRDKTGQYWFNEINPLDDFVVVRALNGINQLHFDDLAVSYGLESRNATCYRYSLRIGGKLVDEDVHIGNSTYIDITRNDKQRRSYEAPAVESKNIQQWVFTLETSRKPNKKWSKWIKVYVEVDETKGDASLLGIERQN